MPEVKLKTHLYISDIHEEYSVNWCGRIIDSKPAFKDNKPIFICVGAEGRMELNTTDMKRVEECAKLLTHPRGRQAITTDTSYIYLLEEDGHEKMVGTVTHNHVKQYQQMFDRFECDKK